MKALKKTLIGLAVVLVLAGAGVYFGFNGAAKRVIEQAGSEALGVPVKVSGLGISVSDLKAKLGGITVGNPAGFTADKLLKAEDISVTLASVSKEVVVISSIVVNGMTVSYERGTAGTNLDRVSENTKAADAAATPGPQIIIQKLQIINAKVIPSVAGLGNTALPIPDITIKNLGSKENPVSAAQVAAQVMNRIIISTSVAIVKGTLKGAARETLEGVKDGLSGLKGVFSK